MNVDNDCMRVVDYLTSSHTLATSLFLRQGENFDIFVKNGPAYPQDEIHFIIYFIYTL